MSVDQLYMEKISIGDPFAFTDFTELISESTILTEEWFDEAAGKGSFLTKVWNMMKRIFSIIKAKCSEVFHGFISIFRTKKVDDKTLDQIAEKVLNLDPNTPGSKHLRFYYDNDKQIKINYIANAVKGLIKEPEIIGHDKHDRPKQKALVLVYHVIKKPHLLDPLIEMVNDIKSNKGVINFELKRIQNAIDALWAGAVLGFRTTISLEEWTKLNEKIVALHSALEVIDDDSMGALTIKTAGAPEDSSLSAGWANAMNDLVRVASFLQLGINTIGDGMRQIYELDVAYHDKINSSNFKKFLPEFVKECVKSNIPSKYIYNAIHQICDKSINANPKDLSVKATLKPLKGNGRFVLFPSVDNLSDKVIKVGYNGLGARGNRNEFMVWDKVKDIPEIANEIYQIYDIGDPNLYVILADKVKEIEENHGQWSGAEEWNKKMREACLRNKIGFIIRCNPGGFGTLIGSDKVICCDYGNVRRV